MQEICPCNDCPDVGCGSYHDICERYQGWVSNNAKVKQLKKNAMWEFPSRAKVKATLKYNEV